MPSRPSPPVIPPLPPVTDGHHHFQTLPLIIAGSLTLTGVLLILFTLLIYRRLYRNRTAPSDLISNSKSPQHYQCRRFSYSQLRRATNSFSDSTQLGHGGFGSVYKADFPSGGDSLAVKVMDTSAGSLQGEREFHNELSLSSHLIGSPHTVSLLGFSSDRRGRTLILVYELMPNRSLQDALLDRKCEELMDWNKRFKIATDIAKGITFLHHSCDPVIIHGDIKPSNILLDSDFKAKIGDFGLARVKSEDLDTRILIEEEDKGKDVVEDNGSILEDTESVITVFDDGNNAVNLSLENCGISVLTETAASPGATSVLSPENCAFSVLTVEEGASPGPTSIPSPETCAISVLTETGLSPGAASGLSPESSKLKVGSKRDWWWKQDNNGGSRGGIESGSVKDYVMEWIGSEIKKERPNNNKEWINNGDGSSSVCKKKKKKEKKRKPREWWKEEFCEELTRNKRKKKRKKKRGLSSISSIDSWFHRDAAAFATRRLLYPSQAFDLIHCSRCRINWTRDDGILLLEINRMLRAGGYFAWAAQPVYKHEPALEEQWTEMLNLTTSLCWKLVKKEGYVAIWQKPFNNDCYLSREAGTKPPLCDESDDPDNVWYTNLKPCISRIPENGYGGNVPLWPARLHTPPDRLQTIKFDSYIARKELFKAESKYWNEIIGGYVRALKWRKMKLRNVLDMRAGFGGFAAALNDHKLDCWVLSVVPVSGPNTLPVIYDRGLLGVMHDWCEPFDTYPRTYDFLHASGLFSIERKRCEMSTILLEMDRILRPGGRAYIRDSIDVMDEIQEITKAMGWHTSLRDTSEGPHSSYRILTCEKRLLRA